MAAIKRLFLLSSPISAAAPDHLDAFFEACLGKGRAKGHIEHDFASSHTRDAENKQEITCVLGAIPEGDWNLLLGIDTSKAEARKEEVTIGVMCVNHVTSVRARNHMVTIRIDLHLVAEGAAGTFRKNFCTE